MERARKRRNCTICPAVGMGIDKLAQFYGNPAKQRLNNRAVRDARLRRALCSEAGWRWKAYRTRYCYRRRALGIISRAVKRDGPAAGSVMDKTQHAAQAKTGVAHHTRLALTWNAAKRAVAAVITLLTQARS